ncbi:MAG: M15 family metallopeptidase [Prevotella sp.]|nr:M15 family metallopeptidase [Prevotella sp.]
MRRITLLILACMALLPACAQDSGFSIDTISDALFQRMQGRSFPANCSTPRSDLRHLRVLHRNAEDSVLHGEMVCNKAIAEDLLDIFRRLYDAHYPIEHIRLIDDYEADDELSMRDNNSSSFCFRVVPGTTKLSKHARGMAVDINTRYNPYVRRSRDGRQLVSPDNSHPYVDRSKTFPYKIEEGDLCYRLFIEHGFTWGGHWRTMKDYQHFEK